LPGGALPASVTTKDPQELSVMSDLRGGGGGGGGARGVTTCLNHNQTGPSTPAPPGQLQPGS
jgi:hypothetical protein